MFVRLFYFTDAPSIRFEPNFSPYKVKINSQINLRCVVDSNPVYQSVEWRRDGILLPCKYTYLSLLAIFITN